MVAHDLDDTDGGTNSFLVREHGLLLEAAERLNQLNSGAAVPS